LCWNPKTLATFSTLKFVLSQPSLFSSHPKKTVEKGNCHKIIEKGNCHKIIEKGNCHKIIEKGNCRKIIEKGIGVKL
jgi:hypothetical protein